MNRKDFIRLMGTGAVALVAWNQLSCSKPDVVPQKDFMLDLSEPQNSGLLNPGGFVYKESVIVFKAVDGNFYALSQICTHEGCTVEYVSSQNDIFCPCHGSLYDIAGKVVQGPSSTPLFQYATSLSGNLLHVFTP